MCVPNIARLLNDPFVNNLNFTCAVYIAFISLIVILVSFFLGGGVCVEGGGGGGGALGLFDLRKSLIYYMYCPPILLIILRLYPHDYWTAFTCILQPAQEKNNKTMSHSHKTHAARR